MKEIPLTRGLVALVDDEDYEALSQFKWFAHKTGYAVRKERHPTKPGIWIMLWMHRIVARLTFGDTRIVDHDDENRLHNFRSNLRICNKAENGRNRGANKNNTSGYKGVAWSKSHKKWMAFINCDRKRKYLGYFGSAEEAHAAYCRAADELHGEFANHG